MPVILLVEDDDQVRDFVRRLLSADGFHVIEARTGAEALSKADEPGTHIDLLLSDMLLPELSGYDVARHIRELNPHVKVVLMTGYVEGEIVQKCVSELNASFLDKPFTAARLREVIRESTGSSEDRLVGNSDFHRNG